MDEEPDFGLTIDTSSTAQNANTQLATSATSDASGSQVSTDTASCVVVSHPTSEATGGLFARLERTGNVLGRGSTGIVEEARDPVTSMRYALKTINYDANSKDQQKAVARELQSISRNSQCPLLVHYYGAKSSRTTGSITIAMEYMDLGALHVAVKLTCPIPPAILRVVAVKMLVALKYLHNTLNIIHRDIKPSNILVNSQGDLKLADFGLARDGAPSQGPSTFVGTLAYLAPETFQSEGCSSKATDIWALGISLCELAIGVHPVLLAVRRRRDVSSSAKAASNSGLDEFGFWDAFEAVRDNHLGIPQHSLNPMFSERMRNFIDCMLEKDPEKRSTATELLEHPWIKEVTDPHDIRITDSDVTLDGSTAEFYKFWIASLEALKHE